MDKICYRKQGKSIEMKWLGSHAQGIHSITFGVPFSKGEIQRAETFSLLMEEQEYPLFSWPLAYWPDGSVKWMGNALTMLKAKALLSIEDKEQQYLIKNGELEILMDRTGMSIIKEIRTADRVLAKEGQLIGIREIKKTLDGVVLRQEEECIAMVTSVEIEQNSSLRMVLKLEGTHCFVRENEVGSRESRDEWLPFSLRLVIAAGSNQIKIIHHFDVDVDGNEKKIKGLGIRFSTGFTSSASERQVRILGDQGVFAEPCRALSNRYSSYEHEYPLQLDAKRLTFGEEDAVQDMPIWNNYRLFQSSSEHFVIQKTTRADCTYIDCEHGHRSMGSMYVGDHQQGLLLGMKDFWQKHPSGLEVKDLGEEKTQVIAWFWSPEAKAMDLGHYDTKTHVISSYEGAHELDATPLGIGNTNELILAVYQENPENEALITLAREIQNPPLLICEAKRYHDTKAIGIFSMVDRSTPIKDYLEEQLEAALRFYQEEVEQRKWYGFWNYGDFMHTYDRYRHSWRYDIGGYAWQNTELAPNIWLWQMFLRRGEEWIFRMAEAMTRHTGEVDIYHLGRLKGLGSRHNVIHWGCGCKEARIAMAGLHRYYYYLTCDERTGELMDLVVDSDYATVEKDPLREYFPKDDYPTHARSGPDWAAFSSNWFTYWERHESEAYRDKLLHGIDCLWKMPYKMLSGSCFGYDPASGTLSYMGENTYGYHLAICMGEPQIWMEMVESLDDSRLKEMLVEFGDFYYKPYTEKQHLTCPEISKSWDWPMFATGMAAYAAKEKGDITLADRAWDLLLLDQANRCIELPIKKQRVQSARLASEKYEIPSVTTNTFSQWCINVILCLELIGDRLEQPRYQDVFMEYFYTLRSCTMKEVFYDEGTANWTEKWFLDGKVARVENSEEGMLFHSGPEFLNDAHHGVLWTKEEFVGDLCIEYEFTKMEEETRCVNILYVQATGSDENGYAKDIQKWQSTRDVPKMSLYFDHMNTYHISYAAYENDDQVTPGYIRARRYVADGLEGTQISPEYASEEFFQPYVKHKITVLKRGKLLFFHIANDQSEKLCVWNGKDFPSIEEGRIGFRQMFTRKSLYKNIRISRFDYR